MAKQKVTDDQLTMLVFSGGFAILWASVLIFSKSNGWKIVAGIGLIGVAVNGVKTIREINKK